MKWVSSSAQRCCVESWENDGCRSTDNMLALTLDTAPLLDWLDERPAGLNVAQIIQWHSAGLIEVAISNRVFDPDTSRMQQHQQRRLRDKLENLGVVVTPSSFRLGISRWSSGDVWS